MPASTATSAHAESGSLSASPSGHYIQYGGRTLMLIGDSGTQCVMQNLNLDYRSWVDDCADRGITAIHIWALVPPRQKRDGSVMEARYGYVYPGATPWARRTDGPLATDGWPLWDLTRFDEGNDPQKHYWPRLRDLCSYAQQQDILVGITLFFGWPKHNYPERPDWLYHPLNVVNGGFLSETKPITTAAQTIHLPGTEIMQEPWCNDWPSAKKTQWVWERYADKMVRETMEYGNVFYVFMDEHSYPEGNCGDHFLTFLKRRGALIMDWGKRRRMVDFVHDDARDSGGDGNARAIRAFAVTPIRPVFSLEVPPYQGDVVQRSIWTRAIGGLHFLFHNDERQETVQTGIMVYDSNVQGGEKGRALERLDWLGHASRFFNGAIGDLDSMRPHNELVRSEAEPNNAVYCLANPGVEYAVYSWSGESFHLDLSAAADKTVSIRFYNPRDGQWTEPMQVPGGESREIHKPNNSDWVLHASAK